MPRRSSAIPRRPRPAAFSTASCWFDSQRGGTIVIQIPLSSPRRRGSIFQRPVVMGPRLRGDDGSRVLRPLVFGKLSGLSVAVALLTAAPALAQDKSIVVASTTSTQDSGLFGHILPLIKMKTGIEARV